MSSNNHATLIWDVADLLRGSFKAHQYGDVILPFTVLRRLDCVLAPTQKKVREAIVEAERQGIPVKASLLKNKAGHDLSFWNTSRFTLTDTLGDPDQLAANLGDYLAGFSENVHDIFAKYKMVDRVQELADANLLFHVTQRFSEVDLRPTTVPNEEMGHIFEELIRKFAEASNETAGEHFTPRDVVRLMVDLLVTPDMHELRKPDILRSIYDPTAGTGGMLSVTEDRIRELNPSATLHLAGQEINPQSFAICKADMMMKGQRMDAIQFGNTLLDDKHAGTTFNYCLSNPPFGVDWKKEQKEVVAEHEQRGYAGRFGPGLPAVSDGSMLFLMHLVSKMREPGEEGGRGRAAIVLNGSPLFTGGAGSGASNIRKWLLERDLLEAIIALPTDMFYNTGIATYIWILSTQKPTERHNKVQLVDGTDILHKMKKGLGSKRNELSADDAKRIVKLYGDFAESAQSKVFNTTDFFYRTISVERPLVRTYSVSSETVERVYALKAVQSFDTGEEQKLHQALTLMSSAANPWRTRSAFLKVLKSRLADAGMTVPATILSGIADAIGQVGDGDPELDTKGKLVPDPDLRDSENVPWDEDVDDYLKREVLPFAPGAWIDHGKTKEGCEIPFTRHFYVHVAPRALKEIDRDLDEVLGRIRDRLEAVRG